MATSLEDILTYQARYTPRKTLMVGTIRSMLWSRHKREPAYAIDSELTSTSSVWRAFIAQLLPTSGTALFYQQR